MDENLLVNQQEHKAQEIKTTKVNLKGKVSFDFHAEVTDQKMFELNDTRSKSVVRSEDKILQNTIRENLGNPAIEYKVKRKNETENFRLKSLRLTRDSKAWYYFQKDTAEMVRVKKTVAYLNNLLEQPIEGYVRAEGDNEYVDTKKMKEDFSVAFEEAHKACEAYLTAKENKAKHGTGIRRKGKVIEIMKMLETEKHKYDNLADSLKTLDLKDFDIKKDKTKSARELSSMHHSLSAVEVEWQNQGNSTDVYKITVVENGKNVTYYIKQNIPLLSENIYGFLERRIKQLEKSLEAKKNNDKDQEEERMVTANMNEDDYASAIEVLKLLKKKIDNASDANKEQVKKDVLKLFMYDFDKLFTERNTNNLAAKYLNEKGGDDIEKWKAIAEDNNNRLAVVAKAIVEAKEAMDKKGEQVALKDLFKEKSAMDWVKEKLNLDKNKDKDLIDALDKLHKKDEHMGVENLFRVSLGKEVELFGQMRNRMKGDEREIAAANNSATYEFAKLSGFTDVVTQSNTRIVRFRDRNGEIVECFCTVSAVAEGKEFVEILKDAEKNHKKIQYSPEAIRQLMRLQMFDLACLQVDRHGRNFKCETDEDENNIVIKKIMSYDHDMSFGEEKLADAFKNEKGETENKGFLKPLTTKVTKNSSLHRYIKEKYFGIKLPDALKNTPEPRFRCKHQNISYDNMRKYQTTIMMVPFAGSLMMNPDVERFEISQKQDYNNTYEGFILKRPTDPEEIKEFEEAKKRDSGKSLEKFYVSEEEQNKVARDIHSIVMSLKEVVIRPDNEVKAIRKENPNLSKYEAMLKKVYTKEEKAKIYKQIKKMNEIMKVYDLSEIKGNLGMTYMNGIFDYWFQLFSYFFFNAYKDDEELRDIIIEEENLSTMTKEQYEQKQNALKAFEDKDGNLEMPSLLHYDHEAFNELKEIADNPDDTLLDAKLMALNFSKEKITKIKERCKEEVDFVLAQQQKAEKFYKAAGWTGVKAKFLLDPEDYKNEAFKDITDFAVDPGNTYLSIDNEKFLYGVNEFASHTSENEQTVAFEEEKKKHIDPKRWKDAGYGKGSLKENIERLLNNPLAGNIVRNAA